LPAASISAPWAHFQLLVEHLADGVTVQDASGRLVYANERGAKMSGYASPEELLRAPIGDYARRFELLDAGGLPVPTEALPGRIALRIGKASSTLRVRDRITGSERWTEVRAYTVRSDGAGPFVVNVFRDVTDIVEQQRLLEEQTDELEEQSSQAQALAEELEQTNDELMRSLQDAEDARALAEERERWLTRLHSLTISLSRAVEPEQVLDIAVGAGLSAFEASGVALWLLGEDQTVLRRVACAGVADDAMGRYSDIPVDSQLPQANAARSGEVVVVESRVAPGAVTTPIRVAGRTIGVVTLSFDKPREFSADFVSMAKTIGKELGLALDRTRTRAELDRARLAAEAASEAKSSFLATMSHELRTPINAILGFTDLLRMGIAGRNPPLQDEYLERIRRSTEHLLKLINDVLDISKIESGTLDVEKQSAPARDVLNECINLMRNVAEAQNIAIETACEDSITYVGDPLRVRQILLNLVSNAIKFSHPGGTIRVICDRHPAETRRVAFSVADHGIGIAKSQLDDIFDPFMQAERGYTRTHGGTGLGLSISRQLARLMDGDVTVTSALGKGSTFVLNLPGGLD
jgi:signal transduction histidine kinase